ncbi:unnamed protein product [Cunninghamella blakesleeana]
MTNNQSHSTNSLTTHQKENCSVPTKRKTRNDESNLRQLDRNRISIKDDIFIYYNIHPITREVKHDNKKTKIEPKKETRGRKKKVISSIPNNKTNEHRLTKIGSSNKKKSSNEKESTNEKITPNEKEPSDEKKPPIDNNKITNHSSEDEIGDHPPTVMETSEEKESSKEKEPSINNDIINHSLPDDEINDHSSMSMETSTEKEILIENNPSIEKEIPTNNEIIDQQSTDLETSSEKISLEEQSTERTIIPAEETFTKVATTFVEKDTTEKLNTKVTSSEKNSTEEMVTENASTEVMETEITPKEIILPIETPSIEKSPVEVETEIRSKEISPSTEHPLTENSLMKAVIPTEIILKKLTPTIPRSFVTPPIEATVAEAAVVDAMKKSLPELPTTVGEAIEAEPSKSSTPLVEAMVTESSGLPVARTTRSMVNEINQKYRFIDISSEVYDVDGDGEDDDDEDDDDDDDDDDNQCKHLTEEDKKLLKLRPDKQLDVIKSKIKLLDEMKSLLETSAEIQLQSVYNYIREKRKLDFEFIRNKYKYSLSSLSKEIQCLDHFNQENAKRKIDEKKMEILLQTQQKKHMLRSEYKTQYILDKQLIKQRWLPPESSPILEYESMDEDFIGNHHIGSSSKKSKAKAKSKLRLKLNKKSHPSPHLKHSELPPPLSVPSSPSSPAFIREPSDKNLRFSKRLSQKREKLIQREKISEAMKRGLPPGKY